MASPKKKLLMLLGAGSSIPLGMPSVMDLGKLMATWAQNWQKNTGSKQDYYGALSASLTNYYAAAPASIRPKANFERVLGEMAALLHWMTPSPSGNALREIACNGEPPPSLAFLYPRDFGPSVTVGDQFTQLLVDLAKHMREKCISIDNKSKDFCRYANLLQLLADRFDLGIYNLNYDTAAIHALPKAFNGFASDGSFRANTIHTRQKWEFIYHLHGSAHYSLVGIFGDAIRWRSNLTEEFFDGHTGLSRDKRSDGRSFPKTTLIAGGYKLDQLLVEPFQSFHATLVRHIHEADAILIGGYGFGDEHVNRVFHSRLTRGGNRPPVVILTTPLVNTDAIDLRNDAWGYDLQRTLDASGPFTEPGHASPPVISELVAGGGFEVAEAQRVAIWHGGFGESDVHADRISAWLTGDSDNKSLASS